MRVLITGGSGFIGRNLVEQLPESCQVLHPGRAELNLLEAAAVTGYLRAHRVDVVVHCATHDAARNSQEDQSRVLDANLRMFFNLAHCEGLYGKLIHYGSGAVYDRRRDISLVTEEEFGRRVPADDYGLSRYLIHLHTRQRQKIVNLRLFAVFGKHEDWEIRFISNACCKAAHDMAITIRQNVRFDYLHVDDLVVITRWFMEHDAHHSAYNVCSADPVEILSLARSVCSASGKDLEIRVAAEGLGREYSGDNSRLLGELGGFSFRKQEEAIAELYAWYDARKDQIPRRRLATDR